MTDRTGLYVVEANLTPEHQVLDGVDAPLRLVAADAATRELALGDVHDDLLAGADAGAHVVQFYDDEQALIDRVSRFLAAGVRAGEAVVVIATEAHRTAFVERLRRGGADVDAARAAGRLVLLDARTTLDALLVDGAPDPVRFRALVGDTLERAAGGLATPRVRAYGEMVDLLWREGDRAGAIALETMWNDLASTHTFALLCAYEMGNFQRGADGDEFRRICASHTQVIPHESYSALGDADARHREIGRLQQRARSLEHEIAQRRALEASLREALARETELRQEAERSVHFNEMFAGMLGHDLRNPLNAVTMGAHFIARSDGSEKVTRAATRILSSAERMARMIDQLLDFTRIRVGGGLPLEPTRFDLAELCFRVKEELEAANPQCVIELETCGDTIGAWDHDRLLQVFSNLVGNAVAHGQAGCRVRLAADGDDPDVVRLVVHNAGAIAADLLPALFEPFRAKKQQRTQGLGLGLFITRQIIVAHGGAIEVSSSEPDGTTMNVQLPRGTTLPRGEG